MPNIVVNDITPRIQYVAAIGQTVFAFPFLMFFPTDINVYRRVANSEPHDNLDILTYNIDYTVTINPQPAVGGTITLLVAAAAGDIITLARNQPDQRLNYYIQGGPFTSNMVNFDFDQIVLMDQQRQMYDEVIGVHYNVNAIVEPIVDNILPILPPRCVWMKNEANTEIIAVPFGGGGGGGDALIIVVVQPGHGFVAGQVVYSNAGTYALALASNAAEAEVIGLVESVIDANSFNLLFSGRVTSLMGLTPGGVYFLSDTVAGALTLVQPTTPGHVSKPLVIASGVADGFFYNMRGKIINNAAFPWNGVAGGITQMQGDQNYYTTGGGQSLLVLPLVCAAGAVIQVKGYGSTGWRIVQGIGQQVFIGNQTTTLGAGGYVESQDPNDDITLLCVEANTIFTVLGAPFALNLTVI